MSNILIIGAGGVGKVIAAKLARQDAFSRVVLASRSMDGSHAAARAAGPTVEPHALDAGNASAVEALIREVRADIVIHAALPYQNMPIMQACAAAGAHYIDTAVPEIPDELWCSTDDAEWYGLQWDMHNEFADAGLTAILGIGSDPGMVNIFCEYARRELFDTIATIDILDVNAGDHGYPFATNFNPEINLREVQAPAHYWADNAWHEVPALSHGASVTFPEIGDQPVFLMDHDEIHSLRRFFPEAKHIRFWMGFGESYQNHFNVLKTLGLLSPDPVETTAEDGSTVTIPPIRLLKAVLPDPVSLAPRYEGKTCICSLVSGLRDGKPRKVMIYNICDHEACYADVKSQAISFTAGVPAVVAAQLLADGAWRKPGVFNAEQLDPKPFLERMPQLGMSWDIWEMDPSAPLPD